MNPPIRPISRQARLLHTAVFPSGPSYFQVLIGADGAPLAFYRIPGVIGAIYCVAAISGGRKGNFWAAGLVLPGWGAVVVWLTEFDPDVEGSGAYAFGIGLGVTLAAIAARGNKVDLLAAGVTALVAGTVFMLSGRMDASGDASSFALLMAVVAIANTLSPSNPQRPGVPATAGLCGLSAVLGRPPPRPGHHTFAQRHPTPTRGTPCTRPRRRRPGVLAL